MEEASGHHIACGTVWLWFSAWALVEDWEVADGSPDSIEKVFKAWVPVRRTRWHGLPLHRGVDLPDCPGGEYGQCPMQCRTSAQCAETLGRTKATYTGGRARTWWPWRTQHLWQRGGEWRWWGTLWDCKSPLGSEACCTAEREAWAACDPGGRILRGPPVRLSSRHIDHIFRQSWWTGTQFQQKQGEPLTAGLLQLWFSGVDSTTYLGMR